MFPLGQYWPTMVQLGHSRSRWIWLSLTSDYLWLPKYGLSLTFLISELDYLWLLDYAIVKDNPIQEFGHLCTHYIEKVFKFGGQKHWAFVLHSYSVWPFTNSNQFKFYMKIIGKNYACIKEAINTKKFT